MMQNDTYKNIFGELKASQLELITKEHPYFTPASFFNLINTPSSDPNHITLTARTALFFNNPYLLQFRLHQLKNMASEKIAAILPLKAATESAFSDIIFEPLHTSDYFASQGVKLSKELNENDKLGKQLKSFTDWLKTLKKLPDTQIAASIPIDREVEKLAEKSDLEVEVITESMAEVLVDQGKYTKAREVYHKLSLQNPDKIAYFAAKIEELKKR